MSRRSFSKSLFIIIFLAYVPPPSYTRKQSSVHFRTALLLVDEYTNRWYHYFVVDVFSSSPPSCHHPPLHESIIPLFVLSWAEPSSDPIPYHLALSLTHSPSRRIYEPCSYIFWGQRRMNLPPLRVVLFISCCVQYVRDLCHTATRISCFFFLIATRTLWSYRGRVGIVYYARESW
ncbi:hypothetical protein EDB89DRAFT_118282 [Lactarius sanguifluus]|nr:hypothetical protein EDB89DRAFT_118282 [Lactarius sanguifluus]